MANPQTAPPQLIRAFNFRVSLLPSAAGVEGGPAPASPVSAPPSTPEGQLGDGGFQECSGLEVELDVQELQEGGRNDGVIRRIGRAKYQPLVLKRGMLVQTQSAHTNELWQWLQNVASGTGIRRYDGIVAVLDHRQRTVATWTFVRGLPAKVSGPQLNARTGEIAIEELHIAHEGLRLEPQ